MTRAPVSQPGGLAPGPAALLPNTANLWAYCIPSHSSPSFVLIWPVGSLVAHSHSAIPYLILSILSPPPSFTTTLHNTSTTNQSNTSICEHKQSAPFWFPSDPLRLVTPEQKENIIFLFQDYFRKGTENLSDNQFMCFENHNIINISSFLNVNFSTWLLKFSHRFKDWFKLKWISFWLMGQLFPFAFTFVLLLQVIANADFTVKPSHQFCFTTKVLRKQCVQIWVCRCVRGWRNAGNKGNTQLFSLCSR